MKGGRTVAARAAKLSRSTIRLIGPCTSFLMIYSPTGMCILEHSRQRRYAARRNVKQLESPFRVIDLDFG